MLDAGHDINHGDLSAVLADPAARPDTVAEVRRTTYARLPMEFAGVRRGCFRALIEWGAPFAVHCTAGKDRSGIAVALILSLPGAHRDDILAEHLGTNAASEALAEGLRNRNQGGNFGPLNDSFTGPLVAADARYLAAMFASVEHQFGSVQPWGAQVLGLEPTLRAGDQSAIRRFRPRPGRSPADRPRAPRTAPARPRARG